MNGNAKSPYKLRLQYIINYGNLKKKYFSDSSRRWWDAIIKDISSHRAVHPPYHLPGVHKVDFDLAKF